ncbi:MAG: hypothetical protein DMG77_12330 [Acidobacteria bacterium]|nr:MAG: hypothetical protein DMG77_12330 [Acidobacteriota bacterium]
MCPGARREQDSYQNVHDCSRLRYGQRAQGRRGEQALAGDYAGAKRLYEEALATYRQIGDEGRVAVELNNIGAMLSQLGDLEGARQSFQQCSLRIACER